MPNRGLSLAHHRFKPLHRRRLRRRAADGGGLGSLPMLPPKSEGLILHPNRPAKLRACKSALKLIQQLLSPLTRKANTPFAIVSENL